jgi:hypothetical protein
MAIMALAVLGTIFWGYTGIANLVGFFSGWVAAILGFYFLQQNMAGAQTQAKVATDQAAEERARAHLAEDKNSKLVSELHPIVVGLRNYVNEFSNKQGKKTGESLEPEEAQKYQIQVDSLLEEVKEKLRKAEGAILPYSIS